MISTIVPDFITINITNYVRNILNTMAHAHISWDSYYSIVIEIKAILTIRANGITL